MCAGRDKAQSERSGRRRRGEDALVVVGDVTRESREADIRREREGEAVHGEALGPFVPYVPTDHQPLQYYKELEANSSNTYRPCTGS